VVRLVENKIEFPYKRSLGPVIGAFSAALAEHRITGIRTSGGRVICPPLEYDPDTGEALELDLVEVGPLATVMSWSWVASPTPRHPLDHPFAFALIQPDGATNSLVHAVDAGDIGAMKTGMRVTPRWRDERKGNITDIEAFVPEGSR
jgi:uncharacterized OB-fold protein